VRKPAIPCSWVSEKPGRRKASDGGRTSHGQHAACFSLEVFSNLSNRRIRELLGLAAFSGDSGPGS
jgi:hypothetical protein